MTNNKADNDLFDLVKAFILTTFGLSGSGMILYSMTIWNDQPFVVIVFALIGFASVFFSIYELLCMGLHKQSFLLFAEAKK